MYFKNIFSITLLTGLLLVSTSCEFDKENLPPGEITNLELEKLLPVAITQLAFNQSAIGGRGAATLMQQLKEREDGPIRPFTTYSMSHSFFNAYWFSGFYNGSLNNGTVILKQAQEEGATHYEAIAKILLAHEFGTMTAAFGDIPFSQAVQGNAFLYPEYDTQESVYTGIQQMLDEAIVLIEQSSTVAPGIDDLLFSGDMNRWKKMAYALKARFFLHTSNKKPENFSKILDITQNKTFISLEEQAVFNWGNYENADNPVYFFEIERSNIVFISDNFAALLNDTNDPRKDKIMVQDQDNLDYLHYEDSNDELFWSQQNTPIPVISFVEVKFMEAEALLKTGATPQAISTALYEGIEASFLQMNIDPNLHVEFISAHASLADFNTDEEILEHIIKEAYISYYGYAAQQVWCNYRRLAYPALTSTAVYPVSNNPSGGIPKRFIYPQIELLYNKTNTEAAMNRQNGALLDVPVWAFE